MSIIKLSARLTEQADSLVSSRFEPWLYLTSVISKFAVFVDRHEVTVECAIVEGWADMDAPTVRREVEVFEIASSDYRDALHEALCFCALYQKKLSDLALVEDE